MDSKLQSIYAFMLLLFEGIRPTVHLHKTEVRGVVCKFVAIKQKPQNKPLCPRP